MIHSIRSEPRILLWDLETMMGNAVVPFYQLKQYSSYINPDFVKDDVTIFCAAWKWLDKPFVASTSILNDRERFENNYRDDFHVVNMLHQLICDADILVAHNGDNFDWKMFAWRCAVNGLEPPKKPRTIDTLKIARKEFHAESKSLRYLAKALGVEDKAQTPSWAKVAAGDETEIQYAEEYCRQDIRTLQGVYERIRPFATNHPNLNAYLEGVDHKTCPKCGHWDLVKRGFNHTNAGKYQAYQCSRLTGGCGGYCQGKKNLKKVDIR